MLSSFAARLSRRACIAAPTSALLALAAAREAAAQSITAQGNVVALTHPSQILHVRGTGAFNEGDPNDPFSKVPAKVYAAQGLTFRTGDLSAVLPGCTAGGGASYTPSYKNPGSYFPAPILNGGTQSGAIATTGAVVTFTGKVTQVGMTIGKNYFQYITAWDASGTMLGEVKWDPQGSASFVGLDSQGVAIAMLTLNNMSLWDGGTFNQYGAVTASDDWIWGGGCAVDPDCDDGNSCTVDTCAAPACAHTPTPGGEPCDDGDLCTDGDVCSAGVCQSGVHKDCHGDMCNYGFCSPSTGACQTWPEIDGTSCDDGDPCSVGEACSTGQCVGGSPKVCAPADGCHLAGTCDPGDGSCSSPVAPDNTACDDGDKCSLGDRCVAGLCTPTGATACQAADACHVAGTCDSNTGACSTPAAPEGTSCDDGDPCTEPDVCTAGGCVGQPKTCAAKDDCHSTGVCDALTGACSTPEKPDGSLCAGGVCEAGACVPHGSSSGGGDLGGAGGAGGAGGGGPKDGCGCRTAGGGGESHVPEMACLVMGLAWMARRRKGAIAGRGWAVFR